MNKKEKRERLRAIMSALETVYPESFCALEYGGDPWKLLIMGRLSAQCTDARVNIVSKELFGRYPDCKSMAFASLEDIENIVRPCGLFRTKAANIVDSSRMIFEDFDGRVPDTMDELLLLPGVGRKIANLILGDVYGAPAIVCDTHCIRICGRLGMYSEKEKDPYKIEMILSALMDKSKGSDFCHRIVMFGREYCMARSPRCHECPINNLCESYRRRTKKESARAEN